MHTAVRTRKAYTLPYVCSETNCGSGEEVPRVFFDDPTQELASLTDMPPDSPARPIDPSQVCSLFS